MHRMLSAGLVGLAWLVTLPAGGVASAKPPARPAVLAVAPMQAAVGDRLTIHGRNFAPGRGRNTVYFKVAGKPSLAARAQQATRTTIKVAIPRSLERRLAAGPSTRVRLRVRSRRLGRGYTAARLSPMVVTANVATAGARPPTCLLVCLPAGTAAALPGAAQVPAPGALIFQEDFDAGAVDTTTWSPYSSPGHAGNGLRRRSALTQENGQLVITASWDGTNIVSGGMSHRMNQRYGSYEFRVRVDPDPSGQTSGVVLTWPQSGLKVPDGEIDMWETGHSAAGRDPWMTFIHRSQNGVSDSQTWLRHASDASQWHTVRTDWTRDAIRTYVDGAPDGQITDPARIPDNPHHLSIQLDAFSNNPLPGPVRMVVDWVKVYGAPAA